MKWIYGYKANIDYSKSINEQELLHETRVILSLIYRDYICTKEEKQKLLVNDETELQREEEILREKYNPDNIFKRREERIYNEENLPVEVRKKSLFKRIIGYMKKLFIKR